MADRIPVRRVGLKYDPAGAPHVHAEAEGPDGETYLWELREPPGAHPELIRRAFHAACQAGSIDPERWVRRERVASGQNSA